jgi:hypothetical protein
MAKIRIPPPDIPVIDLQTGRMTSDWYDAIKALERVGLMDLADVSPGTPAVGQILAYTLSTGKWTLEPTIPQANTQVLIWDSASNAWKAGAN